MNKRKETVEKILALLDGFGYSDSIQILDDVTYTLARTPIKLSSNKTGVSGNLENSSQIQPNPWVEVVRGHCDTCPGRVARYSEIVQELPARFRRHIGQQYHEQFL